jgi:hypothetical protein
MKAKRLAKRIWGTVIVSVVASPFMWAANGTRNWVGTKLEPVVMLISPAADRFIYGEPAKPVAGATVPVDKQIETSSITPPSSSPSSKAAKRTKHRKPPSGPVTEFAVEVGLMIDEFFGTVRYRDDHHEHD